MTVSTKVRLNHCPHCGGNLLRDIEDCISCLQCGYVPPDKDILPLVNEGSFKRGAWHKDGRTLRHKEGARVSSR